MMGFIAYFYTITYTEFFIEEVMMKKLILAALVLASFNVSANINTLKSAKQTCLIAEAIALKNGEAGKDTLSQKTLSEIDDATTDYQFHMQGLFLKNQIAEMERRGLKRETRKMMRDSQNFEQDLASDVMYGVEFYKAVHNCDGV